MRKLLNTLYVTTPETYLSLDGENVVVLKEEETLLRVPLHNLEGIVAFGYRGASPALMKACVGRDISLSFCSPFGRFLAKVVGEPRGNVVLRRTQYRVADDELESMRIARNMLIGKLHNSRWVLERATRDYSQRLDIVRLKKTARFIMESITRLQSAQTHGVLMGIEGEAASMYFSVFDELILQNKDKFFFRERSRRPPMDNVNALLSFVYVLLANDTAAAASTVGLDPFVGFLHKDRPGRRSLYCALSMSHPSWVRGLKQSHQGIIRLGAPVAPLVGAWIETRVNQYRIPARASHPSWVRGLKLDASPQSPNAESRTPRGCVD